MRGQINQNFQLQIKMQIEDSEATLSSKETKEVTIKNPKFSRSILSHPANRNNAGHQTIQRSS